MGVALFGHQPDSHHAATLMAVLPSGTAGSDGHQLAHGLSGIEQRLADALVARLVESRLAEALMDGILHTLLESRELEQLVVHLLTRREVGRAVDELVDQQLGRVLRALETSEALRELVRQQVDACLEHLNVHPEPVHQLIQERSRGMAREMQATVRATALAADDAIESWLRRVLRRA